MAYTLRQLSYAISVAHHGSITEAANLIGISQPAISTALKDLEEEFGFSIFLRQPARKITLTPAGQRFIQNVQRLMESVDFFDAESRGLGHNLSGAIEVGCFLPTAPFIMPIILRAMEKQYPGIDVHIHESNLGEINKDLKSGTIEVALTYDMHPDRKISFETLIEAKPYILLSGEDPLANKKVIHLKDLSEKEMIQFDLPITQDYFQNIASMGINSPKVGYRTKSYEMLRSLVASRMGYSILIMNPESDSSYDGRKLASRPIADAIPLARYGLATAKDYVPRRTIKAFLDLCRITLKYEAAAARYFLS
ncbi:MAG: DNA-binding transcriptional LysR family regulator [Gammaproteobacteria bacterium]|jgi:DNA-binding transcriptional LysR family regulator